MDKTTAQAIHELATTGRLGEESTEAVADVLPHLFPDREEKEEEEEEEGEKEDVKPAKPAASAAKSTKR